MGLDVASVGPAVIEHAVRERQLACHLSDPLAYWQLVHESPAELQRLIEAVVVPETWFFRDRDPFAALGRLMHEESLRTPPERVLRLLSLPCSTGEEPYSMAMALLDAGVPMNRFRIDAIDISDRVLAHGQQGVYRNSSFRGSDLEFRDRHFAATTGGHQIADIVRERVHFQQGNLFSSAFAPGVDIYDVIFCRNVLIYFDRSTQARAVAILARLLAPQGSLFVGASETGVFLDTPFVSARIPMAFAFRKAAGSPPKPKREATRSIAQPVTRRPVAARADAVRSAGTTHRTAAATPPSPLPRRDRSPERSTGLDEARQLADRGRFVDAALRCEEHVRQHGPSADTFYLRGLICDAGGDHLDAGTHYRKALYLDPNHGEALMHLALLMEDQGRQPEAQVLRNRMKRLEQAGKA
jgi:chemotaxis protein methyltransferase WspC